MTEQSQQSQQSEQSGQSQPSGQYIVLVAMYNTKEDAQAVEGQLEQMAKQGYLEIGDAAIAWKDDTQKVHVNDLADEHKRGWGTGAVVGGIVGVIFPPSILAGAAVGAGAGALYHHFRDRGINNKELEQAGQELKPGEYALIAIVRDRFAEQVTRGLQGYEQLGKYVLNADAGVLVAAD